MASNSAHCAVGGGMGVNGLVPGICSAQMHPHYQQPQLASLGRSDAAAWLCG